MTRRRFQIYGRVQGIGYRWFVQEMGERYSLTGWVRNVENGSVETEAQGDLESLELFISDLKNKCRLALVRDISVTELPEKNETGFEIKI